MNESPSIWYKFSLTNVQINIAHMNDLYELICRIQLFKVTVKKLYYIESLLTVPDPTLERVCNLVYY